METDARQTSKRPRHDGEAKSQEEVHLAPPNTLTRADLRAALKKQHREWARALPSSPPPLEEKYCRVAVLHNAAESRFVLEDLILEHPLLCALEVEPAQSRGKFILRGATPPIWEELHRLVPQLHPLDEALPVRVCAPQRVQSREELAVLVMLPYEMDANSFALGLRFKENENRPIAASVVLKNGQPTKVIKLYCASSTHRNRVLRKKFIRWNSTRLTVRKPGRAPPRRTQRAEGSHE